MALLKNLLVTVALTAAYTFVPSVVPGVGSEAQAALSIKEKKEQHKKRKTRKAKVLSKKVYEALTAVQVFMEAEQYGEGARELDAVLSRSRLTAFERAKTLEMYGFLYSTQERYRDATRMFEQTIASGGLEEAQARTALYNLAQLYLVIGDTDKGIARLETWFKDAENPSSSAYILLANAYAQKESYRKAIPLVKTAIEISSAPKERWYQLLMALYYEQGQFPEVAGVLETLVTKWPGQRRYWTQLSAIYGTLDRDKESMAIMELAYKQGYLLKSNELVNLAQLYLYHEVPIRAVLVLEKGLKAKQIEDDEDNWALYANSLMAAEEYKRALKPLARAADLAEDGDLYLRLAQAHFADEAWTKAAKALNNAFKKGNLESPGRAYLLLGVAHYNGKHFKAAKSAFKKASKFKKAGKNARQWIKHIDREIARTT